MTAQFLIDVDVPHALIRITMAGFFDAPAIARFVTARDAAHARLTCPANAHLTLVDIRAMDIQAQDSVAQFRAVLADPRHASRRLAFVVARSLARSQIRRAAAEREACYFETVEQAEAWLLGAASAAA
ncbi:hypothetical protein KZ813_09600 [Sphingomonas sp. RHCKR7]|uniref:hypothetical protein n=1 Tax=Sphingomonas folli TaxID=2862497 RepID=UPI001CA4B50F|nr:hypothetical protein [Sphingomonas folli]MBW6527091.1 hypothetical protein [Sphingomonas folli]